MSILKVLKEHILNNRITYISGIYKSTIASYMADDLAFGGKNVVYIDTYLSDVDFVHDGNSICLIRILSGKGIGDIFKEINKIESKLYVFIDNDEYIDIKELINENNENINFIISTQKNIKGRFVTSYTNETDVDRYFDRKIYINNEYCAKQKNILNFKYRKRRFVLNELLEDEK